ncbi:hypothetical protein SAMN06269117_10640 [Balnearium lithotrophicum]|uniref:Uncharacterized protein n=1 Tax=Balnearium lithotrophicum TaxID=223788 RepID=A0A521BPB2_9BACT|nr:hypothetical protein [Balnearium lithotrophicum]SMO48400.1 hypothetical protein SAMN06269117_10640 [Balnearium lithotrophicum]
MVKYFQGAAFYLFFYLILGLINSLIMYAGVKLLHITPTIILGFLIFLTIFVLFFGFKKSIEVIFGIRSEDKRIILAWIIQFITFIVLSSFIEIQISKFISKVKLFQILSVFINFTIFFITYWLSVKVIVMREKLEVG